MASTKNPVQLVDLREFSSFQLSELSRRCLAERKRLNEKGRAARNAATAKRLAAKKVKLEAELAALTPDA
jgi:hypothetical protein